MIERFINGINEFQNDVFPEMAEEFGKLANGQRPPVLLITCSDSRIVPSLITQSGPGELFVVRNAGNIVPPHGSSNSAEAAAIEYAVSALGVAHIVVCGHSMCGAMQAVMSPDAVREMPAVSAWIQHADNARAALFHEDPAVDEKSDAALDRLIELNVAVQLANLETHPVVARAIEAGKLQLHGWVYHIATGEVFAKSAHNESFERIALVQA